MLAIGSPRALFWPASTTVSSEAQVCQGQCGYWASRSEPAKGQRQASKKAKANYANASSINQRRQTLLQSNNTSVETAQTAKAAQDATLGDVNLANSDVLVAEANISDAKAQQQQQSATLDFHTLAAPYDAR